MANFDKFLDKGNDFLDRAEAKSKERQAMSDDSDLEKKGITAKDMAGAGVEYGKDMLKEKTADSLKNKFLNKDGEDLLNDDAVNDVTKDGVKDSTKDVTKDGIKDGAKDGIKDGAKDLTKDGVKDETKDLTKNAVKEMAENEVKDAAKAVSDAKEKYLNTNPNADNILNKSSQQKNKAGNSGNGNNLDKKAGQNKKSNLFGDSKNPNDKNSSNTFKKNPTAGSNTGGLMGDAAKDAAKDGAKDAAKDVAKDATKDLAKDAAKSAKSSPITDGAGAVSKAAQGDIDGATDEAAAAAAGAVASYFGTPVAGKAASFATKVFLKTEGGKFLKACCGFACLGIVALLVALIMFIPMVVVYITKKIAEIIESIPIVGAFVDFIRDKLTEKLGMDFGDFDFEEINQDSNDMETYAKFKDVFFAYRTDISYFNQTDNALTTYRYESDGTTPPDRTDSYEQVTFDPEVMISDYLPLYKIFAGLEAVHKDAIAEQLKVYFLDNAEFELDILEDTIVTYEDATRTRLVWDDDEDDFVEEEYSDRVKITKTTPKLVLKKATTLTDILTFNWEEQVEGENITWVMTGTQSEINTEVIAIFNTEAWTKSEISSFEYIADCNPIRSLYDAGMYGFTSTFQMPITNTVVAVPFNASSHTYMEVSGSEGEPVMAAADGTVTEVGQNSTNGHYIKIKIGSGNNAHTITYANLKEAPTVAQGGSVTKSQVIGYVGDEFLKVVVEDKSGNKIDPNVFLSSTYTEAVEHVENDAQIGPYTMKSYKQYDYGIIGGVSMADAACGPTSLAMVLSSAKCGSQTVSPTEIASLARQKGLWSSAGASWDMFNQLKSYYGYNVQGYAINPTGYRTYGTSSPNISTVLDAISRRDPVIILIHGRRYGYTSKFTNGGHFIVVDGYIRDGLVRVLDPASEKIERKQATLEELFSGAVQAYVFS